MTLIETVQAQSARLETAGVSFGHGTTNAYDEAVWLVLWALSLPLDALDEHAQRVLTDAERSRIENWVTQRITTRKPLAYLTQEAWLQGVHFYVDERSIVPRSFIAELITDADGSGTLDAWLDPNTKRVLDLCTGNGSLAVLAALAWPEVQVDAADVSDDALAVARINIDKHRLAGRVTLVHSDLFNALPGRYDLILCNPPYVNAAAMAALPAEYHAEPALALDGNPEGSTDGMDLVRRILRASASHLSTDGVLVLEIGNERPHFEHAFVGLEAVWLPVSAGDDMVLLATQEALAAYQAQG